MRVERQTREGTLSVAEGDIHLWYFDLDRADVATTTLSDEERVRADRFVIDRVRTRWVAGRVWLRRTLARYLACDPSALTFALEPGGKPRLAGGELVSFNLSHSGGRALLAVSREGPLGVDLELERPFPDALDIAKRFFAPCEADTLRDVAEHDIPDAFLKIWVCKEAILKWNGSGLGAPLDAFAVEPGADGVKVRAIVPHAPHLPERVSLLVPESGAIAALAASPARLTGMVVAGHEWSGAAP